MAVVSFEQSAKRQIFVEVRPMKSEGRKFDMVQLRRRGTRESGIFRNWKTDFRAAFHFHDDETGKVFCGTSCVRHGLTCSSEFKNFVCSATTAFQFGLSLVRMKSSVRLKRV